MTHSPNSDRTPNPGPDPNQPRRSPRSRRRWRRLLIPTGIVAVSLTGAAWAGYSVLKAQLPEIAERELSKTLKRPVKFGTVERLTLGGVKIGPSSLPPTATDRGTIAFKSAEIRYNLPKILWTRNLHLDIEVEKPSIYLEENRDGEWLAIELPEEEDDPKKARSDLNSIRFRDAAITLVPWGKYGKSPALPVTLQQANGTVRFSDRGRRLNFETTAQSARGGNVKLMGELQRLLKAEVPKGMMPNRINLQVQAQEFLVSEFDRLVKLPIDLQAGRADANVAVRLDPRQKLPSLSGTAQFRGVNLRIPQAPSVIQTARGSLRLQDTLLRLEDTQAQFGSIPLTAKGTVDLEQGFDLTATILSTTLPDVTAALQLKSPVPLVGSVAADVKITGPFEQVVLSGKARNVGALKIDQVDVDRLNAQFRLEAEKQSLVISEVLAVPRGGGQVTGDGTVNLKGTPQLAFDFQVRDVLAEAIARNYAENLTLPPIGRVTATGKVTGPSDRALVDFSQITLRPADGGLVTGTGTVQFGAAEPQLAFQFQGENIPGNPIARTYATIQNAPIDIGLINAQADIRGTLGDLNIRLQDLIARPQQGGSITGAGNIRLQAGTPELALRFRANDLPADGLARAYVEPTVLPFGIGRVTAGVDLEGTINDLRVRIPDFLAQPSVGGTVSGAGVIRLRDNQPQFALNLRADGLSGEAIARAYNQGTSPPVQLGPITATADIAGTLTAPQVTANAVIPVQGGTVNAAVQAAEGKWQANFTGDRVSLVGLAPELRGQLAGRVTASGQVASFRPRDIRVQGQVRLSEGVALINRPMTADFRWDGQKIVLDQALAPGFAAAGFLFAQLEGAGAPALTGFDLNVRTRDLSLQALELPLPVAVSYAGLVDFRGRVHGSPTSPKVAGDVALKGFRLNDQAFESPLTGTLRVDNGVALNLSGVRDRLALTLSPTYQPVAFEIRRGNEFYAKGSGQGDILRIEAEKLPLALANIPGVFPLPLSGIVTTPGLTVNLKTFETTGSVSITDPAFGTFRARQFSGLIRFANGVATLKEAQLTRGETTLQLSATANLQTTDPTFDGQLRIARGRIEDVLELLQVFDLTDLARTTLQPSYGKQADLKIEPLDLADATILEQLQRLAEVRKLLEIAEAKRQQAPIPALRELKGVFDAEITASGSLNRGINATFDLQGQDWLWRDYRADRVIAQGSFAEGMLTLLPVRIQAGDAVIAFSGQLLGEQQSGQFRMVNVPIEAIQDFAAASIGGQLAQSLRAVVVDGKLNATATLSGRFDNPQAIGEITLANGSLNGTDIQSAQGSFQYSDARLDFGSSILVTGNEPLRIAGSLPYKFEFARVTPKSSDIALDVDVRNEGLTLLNLFNREIAWVDGKGEVKLTVRGTLLRPDVDGFIRLEGATISARALPEPLMDVNGQIKFSDDRILITQALRGRFTRGEVSAEGSIPLVAPLIETDPDFDKTIVVNLDNLNLNLKGLYRGAINGRVEVLGTALLPQLTGVIRVSDGEVLLAQTPAEEAPSDDGAAAIASPIELKNLRIELGDRLRVTSPPILNFVAVGSLTVNGPLDDLQPEGVIRLTAGQVNLFTTQFTLDRGYPQQAEFIPSQGLNPNLNVRLIASVPEVRGGGIPASAISAEIAESAIPATQFGGLQTIRVRAIVNGPADQIFDNLTLTSSPSRSETEIVSLIGGGFVTTLGRGDSVLGLANLAGSALLTNVQTLVGNALGLSEFRLFPTLTRSDSRDSRTTSSTLGLAAEAAVDITPTISLSVLKILTTDDPTQFGVRYRLNDRTLIRGSTDFSGDSRLVIEYEARF